MSRSAAPLHTIRRAVLVASGVVVAVGALVLIGWWRRSAGLQSLGMRALPMFPNTAAGFIAAGLALGLVRRFPGNRGARVASRALGAFVLLLGALTFVERVWQRDLGIDLLLFADAVRAGSWVAPGRMAANSAVCFVLAGIALVLLDVEIPTGERPSQPIALGVFLIAFLALVGYAYDVQALYTVGKFSGGMALGTAVTFTVLSLAVLFARPDRGLASLFTNARASGVFSRRLAPAALLVPVLLGWLTIQLGRYAGVSGDVGIAVLVILVVALFLFLTTRSALAVEKLDIEREALLRQAQSARAEAEAANQAKMEFLTNMSHELRTPLNAIAGYVQLIELEVHGPITAEQREALQRTRRSQQHLLALINDVLNFAKLDAGRVEYRLETVEVTELLAGVDSLIRPQLAAKGLQYELLCADPSIVTRGDVEKLRQILLNLLSNAIKFTPSGGRITVSCEAEGEGEQVRVLVRDTGVGIPADKLAMIFEPFVQLDRSLTRTGEGAGLG
ncbi:MAG TPA: HAMP domain-containing sensor histidine kinase, partial [Gemmatimonadaceae bacterium]